MKKILFLLFLLISITGLSQTTYYVGSTGNDATGDGSVGSPWKTLGKACRTVTTSGDIIYVNAGTIYGDQDTLAVGVNLTGSGYGSIITTSAAGNTTLFVLSTTAGTNGNQTISNLKFDGDSVGYRAIFVERRSNVKISNCTVIDYRTLGIEFSSDETISGNFTTGNVGAAPTVYETGNEIHDCIITDNKDNIKIGGQSGIKIYNNTITESRIYATGGNSGHILTGWGTWFKGLKFYNNICAKPLFVYSNDWNFQIEIGTTHGGNEMYGNTFTNGTGIDIAAWENLKGTYDYSWYIHDNIFQLERQIANTEEYHVCQGVVIEGTTEYVIIEKNQFKNYSQAIGASIMQEPRYQNDIRIRYNLFEDIGYTDNSWSFFIAIGNSIDPVVDNYSSNWYIDNNTMIGNRVYGGIMLDANDTIYNVFIRNNIITDVGGYGWLSFFNTEGTTPAYITDVTATNNIIYNCTGDTVTTKEADVTRINFTNSNNITSDPSFVSTSDFRLQAISPARNAGLDVSLTSDYDGNSVPQEGVVDIGAFEYLAIPVPVTGLGWEDHLAKRNFKDDVNFAGRLMIDGIPVTATASELNALVGQGEIISGIDTASLSNRINTKADTSLSNLSSVAINTHLLPATSGSANLGSALLPFGSVYANGTVSLPSTTSIGSVSSTEIGYVNNVTSAIQTQFNATKTRIDSIVTVLADTANIETLLQIDFDTDTVASLSDVRSLAGSGVVGITLNSGTLTLTGDAGTADDITFYTNGDGSYNLPAGGGNLTIMSEVQGWINDSLDKAKVDIRKFDSDTIPLFVFGLGSGHSSDTAIFNNGRLAGAFYNSGSDTLYVTELRGVLVEGTGTETIAVQVSWDVNMKDATPTNLNTTALTVTNMTTGTVDTSFDNNGIPPGMWVWCSLSGASANNKPTMLTLTMTGYRRNRSY